MESKNFQVYFHAPCFDGAVSAAIACDVIEQTVGVKQPMLVGVNYDQKNDWLNIRPTIPFGVVDFLYHPLAEFWVDHHPTTFVKDEDRLAFEKKDNPQFIYDRSSPSCASLLWKHWGQKLHGRNEHFREIVEWADQIDSARYESVEEAVDLQSPALQINLALAVCDKEIFPKELVELLRRVSLTEIAEQRSVRLLYLKGRFLQKRGLRRLKHSIQLNDKGIAVFDVDADKALVNRYAPFYYFPTARYSAGIVRDLNTAKLTVMRNPWMQFPSAPLGQFCKPLGGGGHQRVGSILFRGHNTKTANEALKNLLTQIESWERSQGEIAHYD